MSAVPRPGEDAVPLHRRAIDYRAWIVDDDLVEAGSVPAARAASVSWVARSPRMIQAWSMVGGAMMPGNPASLAAASST